MRDCWGLRRCNGLRLASLALCALLFFPSIALAATDYRGADSEPAFSQVVNDLSRGRVLFVMLHATWCPNCRILSDYFADAHHFTSLDYDVLKLDVEAYPVISNAMHKADGVPETLIVRSGKTIGAFTGAPAEFEEILSVIDALKDNRPPFRNSSDALDQ